jgi:hypothetical protein
MESVRSWYQGELLGYCLPHQLQKNISKRVTFRCGLVWSCLLYTRVSKENLSKGKLCQTRSVLFVSVMKKNDTSFHSHQAG